MPIDIFDYEGIEDAESLSNEFIFEDSLDYEVFENTESFTNEELEAQDESAEEFLNENKKDSILESLSSCSISCINDRRAGMGKLHHVRR